MIIRYWNDHDLVLLCLYSEILVLWRMKTGVPWRTTRLATLSLGEIPEPWLSFAEARSGAALSGAVDNCKLLISSMTFPKGARGAKKRLKDTKGQSPPPDRSVVENRHTPAGGVSTSADGMLRRPLFAAYLVHVSPPNSRRSPCYSRWFHSARCAFLCRSVAASL